MVVVHAFVALVAGFAVLAVLLMGMTVLLRRVAPSWSDVDRTTAEETELPAADSVYPAGWSLGYVIVNLGYSFLACAAGGFVTAWAAVANPLLHVLALGMVVLALAALSALQSRGKRPIWYLLALVVVSPVGVLAGGLVWLRVQGYL